MNIRSSRIESNAFLSSFVHETERQLSNLLLKFTHCEEWKHFQLFACYARDISLRNILSTALCLFLKRAVKEVCITMFQQSMLTVRGFSTEQILHTIYTSELNISTRLKTHPPSGSTEHAIHETRTNVFLFNYTWQFISFLASLWRENRKFELMCKLFERIPNSVSYLLGVSYYGNVKP
jgi:hypothetical protein